MSLEQELLKSIREKTKKLNELLAQSKELNKFYENIASVRINKKNEEDHGCYDREKNELDIWYKENIKDIKNKLDDIKENSGYVLMSFKHMGWNSYKGTSEYSSTILLGNKIILNARGNQLEIPHTINLKDSNNLMFIETGEELVKMVTLRCLTMIPSGELKIFIIDPNKLGESMFDFLKFKEYKLDLINDKVCVDRYEIDNMISNTWNKVQDRIQNYIGVRQCNDIWEYNNKFKDEKLKYEIVILLSFPNQISKESLHKLNNILKHGPKCGIYTFMSVNNQSELPQEFNIQNINNIKKNSRNQFEINKIEFIPDTIDNEKINGIIDSIAKNCIEKENKRLLENKKNEMERLEKEQQEVLERQKRENKGILFNELELEYLQEKEWWKAKSNNKLEATIGKNIDGQLENIVFDDSFVHALIAGTTGSGKSALLHTIIISLSLKYSPKELEFYLLDFKEGLEFNIYKNLPHIKVLSIKSDREFGIGILEKLNEELRERANFLKEKNSSSVDGEFPRILVVIDEFQELFKDNEFAQELLRKIVQQGRAMGIHLIMASQGMAQTGLSNSVKNKFEVRLALRCNRDDLDSIINCSNDEVEYINTMFNNKKVYGNVIYNNAAGEKRNNNKIKVAYIDDIQRQKYINKLICKGEEIGYKNKAKVFDGNSLPELNMENINNIRESNIALLGESVKYKEPVKVMLYEERARNLIILGQAERDNMIPEMLINILYTINTNNKLTKLYYGDYSKEKLLLNSIHNECKKHFGETHEFENDYISWDFETIANEVKLRKEGKKLSDEKILILLFGFERLYEFSSEKFNNIYTFERGENEDNIVKDFMYILQEGPYVGVHTIIQANRVYDVNRMVIDEFEIKVVFPIDEDDMFKIKIPTKVKNMDRSKAIFYDKYNDIYEKFVPYKKPSDEVFKCIEENKCNGIGEVYGKN